MKKLKLALVLIYILSITNISFAQSNWSFFYSTPTTNNYTCIKFLDYNTGFITGEYGTLLKTSNGGANWTFIETFTNSTYNSIYPVNNTVIFAQQNNVLLKSVNGGFNWTVKRAFPSTVRTLNFLNENTGYAAGDNGFIQLTTDGGNNWTDRSYNTSLSIKSICFINTQTGFAATGWADYSGYYSGGLFLKTTNSGLNWSSIYIADKSCYTSVYFKNENNGLVCGGKTVFSVYPPSLTKDEWMYKTTNGGITWDSLHLGSSGIFRTMAGYMNNVAAFSEGKTIKTTNFGINWISLNSVSPTLRFSCFADSNVCFSAGDNGKIIKIENAGNLISLNKTISPYPVYAINFLNQNTGFVLTSDPYLTGGSHIYKSSNSGLNWFESYNANSLIITFMMFANENYGIANGTRELLLTSNSGLNWQYLWYPTTLNINASAILPNSNAYAVGDSGLLVKNSNFGSWSSYRIPNVGNLIDIKFTDENTGYILGNNNILLKSVNSGLNWGTLNLMFSNSKCMFFLNANTGYISANNGSTLHKTTNGGWNWNLIYSGTSIVFNKLYFLDTLKGFTFNNVTSTVEYTSNGGLLWAPILLHYPNLPYCISFINQSTGFLGGYYGTIFRTTNGGIIWAGTTGIQLPPSFSLSQNYPNPFNPTTSIKYNVASSKHIKLVVYDILGKEIETLVNEKQSPGTYEVTWNADKYPSGVYFYKLTAGDFKETKKMLLIK